MHTVKLSNMVFCSVLHSVQGQSTFINDKEKKSLNTHSEENVFLMSLKCSCGIFSHDGGEIQSCEKLVLPMKACKYIFTHIWIHIHLIPIWTLLGDPSGITWQQQKKLKLI